MSISRRTNWNGLTFRQSVVHKIGSLWIYASLLTGITPDVDVERKGMEIRAFIYIYIYLIYILYATSILALYCLSRGDIGVEQLPNTPFWCLPEASIGKTGKIDLPWLAMQMTLATRCHPLTLTALCRTYGSTIRRPPRWGGDKDGEIGTM